LGRRAAAGLRPVAPTMRLRPCACTGRLKAAFWPAAASAAAIPGAILARISRRRAEVLRKRGRRDIVMDRKSIIILAVAVLLFLAMSPILKHFFPDIPLTPEEMAALTNAQPTNVPAATATATASTTMSNGGPAVNSSNAAPLPLPSAPEQMLRVTNEDLIFTFTSHGGGLKTVALKKYPAIVKRSGREPHDNNMAVLNAEAPAPVLALLGNQAQGDNYYHLTQQGNVVTAEKTLANGLRLVKEFDIGTNYLFTAHLRLENTTGQALQIPAHELVAGTATPVGPLDDPTAMGAFWYNGVKAQNIKSPWFANRTLGCIPGTPRTLYEEGAGNVAWAAVHNQFFTLAAIPSNPAPQIMIHPVAIPPPLMMGVSNATTLYLTNGLETTFAYPATVLPPHQTLDSKFTFYAGPKEYKRLAQIGSRMNNNLDLIMDFTGPWGFFSKLLLLSMNGLNALGLPYGWTIIAITLIIKIIFWPLTRASTRSQKRMQALQPQLKAIADKYKDDPVKKNQKTMEFMKEKKVSPLGSCLPMLFQIPVFAGFYYMLRNAIELRGVHFLWAADLSQPDTVAILAGFPINPLPLIMGATQLWQSHLLPASPGVEPGQQKMMRYMPLMFVAMFYKVSAGLTLYWTVSNLLGILQTKMTRMADEAEAKAPPAVTAPKKIR
jgi:YidC/Oxa1 family membrane protein insertase